MKNYLNPLNLGKFWLGTFDLILIVLVGTPYKRPMSLRKKKEQSVLLALKPEQGPRGIRRKSLKPDALNLYWLGVTDLNTRYNGE